MEDEHELMTRCREGVKSSFGKLVAPYLQEAYAISFSVLKSKELVEDAIQNSLIEAYKNIMAEKQIRKFRSWFLSLVYSRSIDLIRKNVKELCVNIESVDFHFGIDESPLTALLRKEERDSVTQAIHALPLKYRMVITLHYFHNLSIQEIAQALEIKEGTIKSRLYNARRALGHLLTKREALLRASGE